MSGRKEDRFPPTSRRRDLGSGPWEGQGKPGACSQLWRGGCLTRLTMDSTRLGEWAQIPFVLQLPRQNEALQVRKAGDRALVKDTLSRMALGPGRQGRERPWPRSCLPPSKAGRRKKEVSKGELYSWGRGRQKRPCLYGFSLTSGGWVGLSWEVTGRQWLCLGGRRQIWYMALSPGQKDLARVDRQQDVPPYCLSSLQARGGGWGGGGD